jgi:hypothetical protein
MYCLYPMYCLCVNVYCHRMSTQLQLTNMSISKTLVSSYQNTRRNKRQNYNLYSDRRDVKVICVETTSVYPSVHPSVCVCVCVRPNTRNQIF